MERPRRATKPSHYEEMVSDGEENEESLLSEEEDASENSEMEDSDDPEEIPEVEATMNLLPTESGIAQARLLALEQEATLVQIQAEHDKQKAVMDKIQDRLQATTLALFKTKSMFAGIRRLPTEILGEVFIFHVHGNLQSPWIPMHVSRTWRAAAALTRPIWGAIMLMPLTPRKKGTARVRIIDGKEVCTREIQVQRALNRAGATALDLHLRYQRRKGSRWSSRMNWLLESKQSIHDLLRYITRGEDQRKLYSLEIDIDSSIKLDLTLFDAFNWKELDTIRFDNKYPELMRKIKSSVTTLRRLAACSSDILLLENVKWLDQLEELDIRSNDEYLPENRTRIRKPLLSTTALRSLSINGGIIADKEKLESSIDMNHLTRLVLRKVSGFWPIECPNLTHLTMECLWGVTERLEPNSIHLPYLRVFNFICNGGLPNLCAFVVPALHTMDLEGHSSKQAMRDGMQMVWGRASTPNINPVVFRIHHSSVHHKVVANAVRAMTSLEELTIEQIDVGTAFFQELHPQLVARPKKKGNPQNGNTSTWVASAPKMKVLIFDLRGKKSKSVAIDAYEKAAKELLAMRRKANVPMERIELRSADEDEWRVLRNE